MICDDELIDVEPGDTTEPAPRDRLRSGHDHGGGDAVLDLENGQPVAVASQLNRQQPFGGDVITRISATMMDELALGALRQRAHETMSTACAARCCAEGEVQRTEVYEITVCGNVTMMQLALGIDPEPLSMAPFVVATHQLPPIKAS